MCSPAANFRRTRALWFAAIAWAVLVAAYFALDATASRQPVQFVRRLVGLALPMLSLWAIPLALSLPFGARRRGNAIGAALFGLAALAWIPLGLLGRWLFASPFGLVLWGDPHFVHVFAAQHPHLDVSTYPIEVRVSDREGRSIEVRPLDLHDAAITFEPCGAGVGPERFGGVPPHPASHCAFRYRVRQPERDALVYVFEIDAEEPRARPHFEAWAASIGAHVGGSWSGTVSLRNAGRSEGTLDITTDDRRWTVRIVQRERGAQIYLPEGGVAVR